MPGREVSYWLSLVVEGRNISVRSCLKYISVQSIQGLINYMPILVPSYGQLYENLNHEVARNLVLAENDENLNLNLIFVSAFKLRIVQMLVKGKKKVVKSIKTE